MLVSIESLRFFQMSVDLDSSDTFLVADTSVLIRSLPMVRAVIESSQPYTVYVPYVVLTELDKGRTAAPVNRLLCRYMKQKHPRIIAQGVQGHKEVTQASGITPKNDDLILGAALKLKEEGEFAKKFRQSPFIAIHSFVSLCLSL